MVKQAFLALMLVALLAPGRAQATPEVDEAVQAFMTVHGPMAMVELEQDGSGAWFAGMFTSAPLAGEADLAAMTFLERWQGLWGFDPAAHLEVADVWTLATVTYVKLDQVHDGVRVQNSGVKVTLDRWNQVRQVALRFGRSQGYTDATPTLALEQAFAILASTLPELRATGQSRIAYLPDPHGLARLAWVLRSQARGSHEAPEVYIDAHTGEVLFVRDTNVYADGRVYDPNPVAEPTVLTRELLNLTSTTNLDGTFARSYSCTAPGGGWDMCPDTVRHATPDTGGDYLYDPVEPSTTDAFAEVTAYYHLDKINRHMRDSYGHAYSCSGHDWMEVFVNMDYENAWYSGGYGECSTLTVGQGTYDFAYDSAIIYHEFGHGINHTYTDLGFDFDNLGPDYSPQGVDEAFADYWAASLIGRPVIGEYASLGTPGELGFRDLSEFAACPDDIYGEGHYDSPMLSSCLWEIREAIGQTKSDRLALAVLGSVSAEPDFDEIGRALLSQASVLEGSGTLTTADVAAVDAAVANHTLVGCERIVQLFDGDAHLFFAQGWWSGMIIPSGVQFMLYAPPGATRLTANLSPYTAGNYTMYVNRDAPVRLSMRWGRPPDITVDDYDYMFTGSPERVSFTEWSDDVIEPDTEYYFTYTHDSDFMVLAVDAIIVATTPPDAEVDAVTDPVDDPGEDPVADVPTDMETDTSTDPASDTPTGQITDSHGCGCSLVR